MISKHHLSAWLRSSSRAAIAGSTTRPVEVNVARYATRTFSSQGTSGKNLLTDEEGVHQTMRISKSWRQKPLFRRQGDVRFKTGMEAANLLIREANRRDAHEQDYIDSVTSIMQCLSPVFDRNPKLAFVAKTLIEPERFIQFRVAWIDDVGVNRLNRGFRMQYSSALGPYAGSLHFGSDLTASVAHALAFDTVFSNAVTGFSLGAAVGGSDFNPLDKSEVELQRFCQSYSTELAKYIGPDQDIPFVGMGCGKEEMGYIYGQYKRIKPTGNFMSNSNMLQVGYLELYICLFCCWSYIAKSPTKIIAMRAWESIANCNERVIGSHLTHCYFFLTFSLFPPSCSTINQMQTKTKSQRSHARTHARTDPTHRLPASLLLTLPTAC